VIGVTWLHDDPLFASARLRSIIPRKILTDRGKIRPGDDVVIAAKHGWSPIVVREASKRFIMDVCDDHFEGDLAPHYRLACALADRVTCNSKEMAKAIEKHTGITATVIDDPWEDPELEPTTGEGVLWFGHSSNMPDLHNVWKRVNHPLMVINNANYTPEALDSALKFCRCTIIPTGAKTAKSANRAIRSIRYGKFPVCGVLPAYQEIGLGSDDPIEVLDRVMATDMTDDILHLQDVVRVRFDPERIAEDWLRVIKCV
jgi:hypothetical protein